MLSLGNPSEMQNIVAMYAKQASRAGKNLIVIDPRETEMTRYSNNWIRIHPENIYKLLNAVSKIIIDQAKESSETINYPNLDLAIAEFSSFDSLKIAKDIGIDDEEIKNLASLLSEGTSSFIFGTDLLNQRDDKDLYLSSLLNLYHLTGNINNKESSLIPLINGANQIGAIHMGINGAQNINNNYENQNKDRPKLCLIFEDGAEAATIKNNNDINNAEVKVLFTNKKEYINKDYDLIFPVTDFSSRAGTYINLENRIQFTNSSVNTKDDVKEVWQIINDISKKLKIPEIDFQNKNEIFKDISKNINGFNLID